MTENIFSFFRKEGRTVEVSGRNPLVLEDKRSVWLVTNGEVNVFAVLMKDGEPASARRPLFSVPAGELLFGVDPGSGDERLVVVAIGLFGTKLLKIGLERFRDLTRREDTKGEAARLVDMWVERFFTPVASKRLPVKYRNFKESEQIIFEPQIPYFPKQETLWIKPVSGATLLLGRKEWVAPRHYFPVTRKVWQLAQEGAVAQGLRTASMGDELLDGIASFSTFMLSCVKTLFEEEKKSEERRLEEKLKNNLNSFSSTLKMLGNVMEPRRVEARASEQPDNLLLMAARRVGDAAGIQIADPPKAVEGLKTKDPLRTITNASRIQFRELILKGEWWRQDCGPILALLEEGKVPVALIPTSPRSYTMFNPADSSETPVDAQVADALTGKGRYFYRSLPARKLVAWDLLKFGKVGVMGDLYMVIAMGVAGGLLGLVVPWATGILIDSIIPSANMFQLLQMGMGLLVAAMASSLFQLTRSIAMLRVEGRMDSSLQAAVWDRVINLPASFFRDYSPGDLVLRANAISQIRQTLSGTTVSSILSALFSSFNLVLLFYYSWKLALVAVALVLFAMFVTSIIGYITVKYQRRLFNVQGKIAGITLELILGIAKIRNTGSECRAFSLWADHFFEQKKIAFKARLANNVSVSFNTVYPVLANIVIFGSLAFYLKDKGFSTGAFLAFNSAFGSFLAAGLQMSSTFMSMLNIVPLYERAMPILQATPEVDEVKTDPGELQGAIEVSNVCFSYQDEGPEILKNVSVRMEPGEFIAIVGSSGSGKSTLFRLLLGFDMPSSGTIYYDRRDLADLDLRYVRRQMGVVLQSSQLLAGDIFSNIVGASNLTMDDALEAVKAAGLEEDINEMPMGMQTMISEGSGILSGGQKQRLLIARAIARKPRILFFDEATSALDNRTQSIVSESIERLNATRVIIAHRLSTVISANRIYVLDEGRIVQEGNYESLMKEKGVFYELARRQVA